MPPLDPVEALVDGVEIDWSALTEATGDARTQRRHSNLRMVARIAEVHRSLDLDAEPVPEGPSGSDVAPSLTSWGHLTQLERIAAGGFGELYRAYDRRLDCHVALKLLRHRSDGRTTEQQLAEARDLARISHPNVVIVHGADVHEGRAGLWMELVQGETLTEVVRQRGVLSPGEAIAIGRDLCGALAAVDATGLVHGDVKADNVIREHGGRIVLTDFGAGRRRGATTGAAGTPLFLAPEALAGGPASPQGDLYSLGVLLFFLLTGRYPYEAPDLASLRQAHATGARLQLRDLRPELPQMLVDTIERVLSPDPAARFTSAGRLEQALRLDVPAPRPRRRLAVATAVAAMVALAAGVWWGRVVAVPRSMAVLPLTTGAIAADPLVVGLFSDMVRELQRHDIEVRTPAEGAQGQTSVDFVVATEVERRGGVTTVQARVQRAGVAPLWKKQYEVDDDAWPRIGREIGVEIALAIGARLRPGAPLPVRQPNVQAYDAYQRGRFEAEQRTEASLQRARDFFDRAIRLDREYGDPWVGKADVYLTLGVPPFGSLRPMEARKLAASAIDEAERLQADPVAVLVSRAWAAVLYDWDWEEADRLFKRAIGLNPEHANARHWYAMFLTDMGNFTQARAELTQAYQRLGTLIVERDFAWIDFCEGRYPEAIAQLHRVLDRNAGFTPARHLLARALALDGQIPAALETLERMKGDLKLGDYLSYRGYIEALGKEPRAEETLAELVELARTQHVTPYYLALIETALGRKIDAIASLRLAYKEQDSTLGSVYVDPRFASLRSEPGFQALLVDMKFPR